ncbi:MAG TPA: DUF6600 domain-containing protein [Polyangiaceae bacterium]
MKRAAGLVTLLGLAFSAATRPALAQDGASNSWFDGSAPAAPAGPAPQGAAPGDAPPPPADVLPSAPERGPNGESLNELPTSPPPQGTQQGPQDNVPETDPRALSEFRPTLDPYGTWVDDQKYGTVWVPNRDAVGEDFAPYVSAGRWALSDDGDWVWQSDYPFGDVVFHYGRWVWLPGTGWAWVAGRRYANAWVTWRVPTDDYGYVGWAPMPPAWGWYGGSAVSLWWYPPAAYVFCPSGYAFSYNVHSYIVHDRYVIRDVAAHTRNYSDGGRGGVQHIPASPRVLPANSAPPRGPSLQSAHVPPSMAPSSRVTTRSSFGGSGSDTATPLRSSTGYARPSSVSGYQGMRSAAPSTYRPAYGSAPRPVYSQPSATSYRALPQHSWPVNSAPRSYAPSAEHYSAPAYRSAPAPAYHYSAPAVHYSAPAVHYSAPAYHSSAPAFHSAPSHSFHSPSRR